MAAEQNMKQAITQSAIKAMKAAIMIIKGLENPAGTARPLQMMSRAGEPALTAHV